MKLLFCRLVSSVNLPAECTVSIGTAIAVSEGTTLPTVENCKDKQVSR